MKLGLKLWSINTEFYFEEAKKLFEEGWFDYIELYVVPKTLDTISKWKESDIPFTLHAPHFMHGVNLAKKENETTNLEIFEEVKIFADELNTQYIVVHGGIDGSVEETTRQLKSFNEPKILIENKPYKALPNKMDGKFCRGATIEEIEYLIKETGYGFCLDIGHSICSANSLNKEPYEYLRKFNTLKPICYHLSDNFVDSQFDKHLHFGEGNYDFKKIFGIIDTDKNIAIETNKNSNENLIDFVEDVKWLKNL